ncbi:unnamed protein product [Alopecurus aequalis]
MVVNAGESEIAEGLRRKRKRKARPDAGTELRGVRRKASGTYGAQIWDPLRRTNVWMGTFGTAKDAAKAYGAAAAEMQTAEGDMKKKTATAELQAAERAVKKKTAAAERAVKKKTAPAEPARPGAWSEFHGVRRGPSGKYMATIWHPLSRTQEYLGSVDNAEDAAKAYDAAVVNLPFVRKEVKKDAAGMPYSRTEFRGVSRTNGGKYRALITQTDGKAKTWLGTSDTAEEAARAYDAAAVKLHGAAARTNFEVDAGTDVQAAGPEKAARPRSGFRGVCQQRSGKYTARICDPVRRARLYLGLFDKAEDAARAYDAEAIRLRGERAITNFKRPGMDLDGFTELDPFSGSIIPGAQLDDVWTGLLREELQPVDELLKDMDFTDVAA